MELTMHFSQNLFDRTFCHRWQKNDEPVKTCDAKQQGAQLFDGGAGKKDSQSRRKTARRHDRHGKYSKLRKRILQQVCPNERLCVENVHAEGRR